MMMKEVMEKYTFVIASTLSRRISLAPQELGTPRACLLKTRRDRQTTDDRLLKC
jgi:hypothetical protein